MPTRIDRGEFERVVRAHHARVYRAARRAARDDAEAEDAVSEVFRRLFEGRIALADARDPGALLSAAAAREVLAARRSETARARREEEVAMRGSRRSEETEVERLESEAVLAREIEELPTDLRAAVLLRCTEGLAFTEVGAALGVAESTAHERVQRGLERLRERLARLGFAVMATGLDERLRGLDPPRVPAGLEARLLALKPASWLAAHATVLGVASVAVLAAGSAWIASGPPAEDRVHDDARIEALVEELPRPTGLDSVDDSARTARAAAVPEPDEPPRGAAPTALASATFSGRVVDVLGLPVAGAFVRAHSRARAGKFAVFSAETRTDDRGAFALELEVGDARGEQYDLAVDTGTLRHADEPILARPGAALPARTIRLAEEVLDRPGAWTLDVHVRDARGTAIEGALVQALRPIRSGTASWLERDDGAQTDAAGRATLRGTRLGPELVRVDARAQGFAIHEERRRFDAPGPDELVVNLTRGVDLVLRVTDELGRPAAKAAVGAGWTQLRATETDPNAWFEARVLDEGTAVIAALAPRPHSVHFRSEAYSAFTLHGVVPGGDALDVRLKKKQETRPGGTHDTEIHGVVVDVDGAPVPLEMLDVVVERVADDSPALQDGDFWPLWSTRRSAQVMQVESTQPTDEAPPPNAFVFDGLEPGRYLVSVNVAGRASTFAGPFELGMREIAGPIQIRVAGGVRIEGVVRDADGGPIAGAFVFLVGPGELSRRALSAADGELRASNGRGRLPIGLVRTDGDGRFVIPNGPADRALRVVALHPDREPGTPTAASLTDERAARCDVRCGAARTQ